MFAALTAIFAKLGLEGIDADLATLVRTVIILVVLAGFVYATAKWSNPLAFAPKTGCISCSLAWRPAPPGSATSGP